MLKKQFDLDYDKCREHVRDLADLSLVQLCHLT